jgi:hypothetical protein
MLVRRRFDSEAVRVLQRLFVCFLLPAPIFGVAVFCCVSSYSKNTPVNSSLFSAACIETKFNLGDCEGFLLWHHVRE